MKTIDEIKNKEMIKGLSLLINFLVNKKINGIDITINEKLYNIENGFQILFGYRDGEINIRYESGYYDCVYEYFEIYDKHRERKKIIFAEKTKDAREIIEALKIKRSL